jgi:predicted alpha/beta hydrolase family esterase
MNVQKKIALGFIRAKLNSLAVINRKKAGAMAFTLFCTPLGRTRKSSTIFEPAEKLSFQYNGLAVNGFRFNPSGDKKVLILHGFSSGCQHFDHYIPLLIEKNYCILAFDAPAHGRSEGQTVNAVEYSEMIQMVNLQFGPLDAYIAHSFGGLSVCLALEHMAHSSDTKLMLIAPATETSTAISSAFKMLKLKNPHLRKALEDNISMISGKPVEWYSIRRAMHQIDATVNWFHDEDDHTTPLSDALEVKNDAHPNISFHISSGLGHSRIYRDPQVVQQICSIL